MITQKEKMMAKTVKTNAMRLFDAAKAEYKVHTYGSGEAMSGTEGAAELGEPAEKVFKTLVTEGASRNHYVFVVPVEKELDLKKAAKAVGEKSIAMIKSKELLPLTGYIHGGCSPVGMKKFFATTVDHSAKDKDSIFFSAGKIGFQIETAPSTLEKMIPLQYADITV